MGISLLKDIIKEFELSVKLGILMLVPFIWSGVRNSFERSCFIDMIIEHYAIQVI